MELQQLQYFRTVARLGHMTRASEELQISQPALSITISRLEESVGVALFDRRGRNICLNRYGEIFLEHVDLSFSALEEGNRRISDLAGLENGTLSLASANLTLLPHLLRSFSSAYPQIKFRLSQSSTSAMQNLLESGDVDFCICSPPITKSGVTQISLVDEEVILIVPHAHPLWNRTEVTLRELQHESFVNLKSGYGMRDVTDDWCHRTGFTPDVTIEVSDPSLITQFVRVGMGIAFFPANVWNASMEPDIQRVRISDPICRRTIGLSWLTDRYMSTVAMHFQEFVTRYFQRHGYAVSSAW